MSKKPNPFAKMMAYKTDKPVKGAKPAAAKGGKAFPAKPFGAKKKK